jgi:hypothetical protein
VYLAFKLCGRVNHAYKGEDALEDFDDFVSNAIA